MEIERARVGTFAAALHEHAARVLAPEDLVAVERVDAVVGGDELGMTLAEELALMAPYGQANPSVSLLVPDATFADLRPMGEGRHVRFSVHSRGARARAVAFGNGGRLPVGEGEPAEATFALEVNEWAGVCEPRLVLRQAWPAHIEARATPPAPGIPPSGVEQAKVAAGVGAPDAEPPAEHEELVLFALP
jgi:single-stranded-DNA-specific exonuclease